MTQPESRLKVLYIMGWGRSGSTLLDSLLGAERAFFSAGEAHAVWKSSFRLGFPCSCGQQVTECPVWGTALAHTLGDRAVWQTEASRLERVQHRLLRERRTLAVLRELPKEDVPSDLRWYASVSERLYLSLAETTGSTILVDSSKVPTHAACLRLMHRIDPYLVHLTRDPRATAYSWSHPRSHPGPRGPVVMRAMSPTRSTVRWLGRNILAEAVCRHARLPCMRIRYEDLVEAPSDVMAAILRHIDAGVPPSMTHATGQLRPSKQTHMVEGNPMRFSRDLTISPDIRWKHDLGWRDRVAVTTLSSPLLRRYDYPYRVS